MVFFQAVLILQIHITLDNNGFLNVFPDVLLHKEQTKGLVWVLICFLRFSLFVKSLVHIEQEYGPFSVWIRICLFRLFEWENDLPQKEQLWSMFWAWALAPSSVICCWPLGELLFLSFILKQWRTIKSKKKIAHSEWKHNAKLFRNRKCKLITSATIFSIIYSALFWIYIYWIRIQPKILIRIQAVS